MKTLTDEQIDEILTRPYIGWEPLRENHNEFWEMRFSKEYKQAYQDVSNKVSGKSWVPEKQMGDAVLYLTTLQHKALYLMCEEEGVAEQEKNSTQKQKIQSLISRLDVEVDRVEKLLEDVRL